MKKFLQKLLVFSLLFFVLEKAFFVLLYRAPGLEKDRRLEQVLNGEINKEIIVCGSSRGARNIIASDLEKATGKSCFNLSYPGSNLEFHEFLLRSLLKFNKTPKTFILAVDSPMEFFDNNLKFRFDRLYPLAINPWVNEEMISQGEKNQLSRFMALARINKTNFDQRKKKFSRLDTILPCGSMPVSFQRTDRAFRQITDTAGYDRGKEMPEKIRLFREIQKTCRRHHIRLVLVMAPNYYPLNLAFVARLKELMEPGNRLYLYDRSNPVYRNQNFFYDEGHLKTNGAKIFTGEFSQWLKAVQQISF